MNDKFYELRIKSQDLYDDILELIFSFGFSCVEECEGEIILRDEQDLSDIKYGIDEYAARVSEIKGGQNCTTTTLSEKPNKDWINEYKKGVKPVLLGDFYIRPSWEAPKEGTQDVIIDPALAFGSGHHESTSSCILLLQKYAKSGASALDVGCGSGILSVILAKLGCVVDACDTDEQATDSTLLNLKLNQTSANKIWTGSIAGLAQKYDIVVANIIADVIFMLNKDLKNILKNNAYLVLSGILERYEQRILSAFSDLELIERRQEGEWLSFVFKK